MKQVLTPPATDEELAAYSEWLAPAVRSLEVPYKPPPPKPGRVNVTVPQVAPTYQQDPFKGTPYARRSEVRIADKTYLIRCGDFVKIGMACDVERRLRDLMSASPYDLEVIKVFAGGRKLERSLHLRFAAHRHRDEWFRLEGELAFWIEAGCPL